MPEFTGGHTGLGPWEPVLRDGKLYGRGAADDGYALFSSLARPSVFEDIDADLASLRSALADESI